MSSTVLAVVLSAALLHALWNSLVKSASDKFLTSAAVCLWCGLVALAAAVCLPIPDFASLPCVVASALIHIVYFLLVGRLYRNADLSVAYPMMRGVAPLFAAIIAFAALGEKPDFVTGLGAAMLVAGVLTMALSGLSHGRIDRTTVGIAVLNGFIIATYSVVDGEGARLAGPTSLQAFAYNAWADALTAILFAPLIFAWRGRAVLTAFVSDWPRSLAGGAAAFGGYALVVWAMTQTEIAPVAALRETSAVFAALIGVVVLGEPFKAVRAFAALIILAGVVTLRLA